MKRMFLAVGVFMSFSTGSMLKASIPPCGTNALCFNFGGAPNTVAQGSVYNSVGTNTAGRITVYAEQVDGSGNIVTPATVSGQSTLNGLFQVDTSQNPNGTGIAPYDPHENTASYMSAQLGIADFIDGTGNSNILELAINRANIPDGTTLNFLMQAGHSGDSVAVFTGLFGTPTSLNTTPGTTVNTDLNAINNAGNSSLTNPFGPIGPTSMASQFSIVTNTSAAHPMEFIGIAADCQYLLLTQITGTLPSGQNPTPEPAFYGILMLAMVALTIPGIRRRFVPEARS